MCCPYFSPVEARIASDDARCSMLPLGGFWTGVCGAGSAESGGMEDGCMLRFCNLGYARGRCSRFPEGGDPDAVRFTIASDGGESLGLYYVVERDHVPFAHGRLDYSRLTRTFQQLPSGDRLARQAQAYIESYLRRLGNGR